MTLGTRGKKEAVSAWVLAATLAVAAACVVLVVRGRVILDEGWYISAGRLVRSGALPYRDFFFPQTPLSAYVFAPLADLGPWTLLGERLLCLAMGFCGLLVTLATAFRLGGGAALSWAAAVLLPSASFWYGISTARSYSLVVLVVALGVYLLASDEGTGRRYAWGTAFLSLAVAARLSVLALVGVVWVAGVWRWRRDRQRVLLLSLAALLPAAVVLLPLLYAATERFFFHVVDFHNAYYGATQATFNRRFAIPFVVGILADQPVALMALLLMPGVLSRLRVLLKGPGLQPDVWLGFVLLTGWLALLLVHITRTVPFPHHQTMFLPLLALGVAWFWARVVPELLTRRLAPIALLLGLGTLPWQDAPPPWRNEGGPAHVAQAAASVARQSGGRPVLVFDPLLAVLSGARILPGYEAGMFSYWPGFDGAKQLGARNDEDLLRDIKERAPSVLALDQDDLERLMGGRLGREIMVTVARNYRLVEKVGSYGQFGKTLFIFVARDN